MKKYSTFEKDHGVIKDKEMRSILKAMYEEAGYSSLTEPAFTSLHNWIKGRCLC